MLGARFATPTPRLDCGAARCRRLPGPFPGQRRHCRHLHAARDHEPFATLAAADRRLTLALLSYSDSLRVYTSGHGQRETIGQHRIRWARTAGVSALPVWFDATTVQPPREATILQRG